MFIYCIMDYKNIISVHKSKQQAEKLLRTLNATDTRLSMPLHIREGYPRHRIVEFASAKDVLLHLETQQVDLNDLIVHAHILRQEEINRELRTGSKKNFYLNEQKQIVNLPQNDSNNALEKGEIENNKEI